ncbi:ankyrin repeat domain-containing protein|uniref:ankyrin repeat domain-containing protein n=1 Tax=Noviherbaspirillum sp. L7-7A TaxID=2850560 RepID=UPI001C2B81A5|nr:ankyrin repeat domain-containing protein [Noviherbaspirillum sp. L7-7A]MBV0879195.1 ankyrin repeat domain-containing protein [Noviherbaspirillum sp. L7-7A]
MDATTPSSLSPRHVQTASEVNNHQTRQSGQMPPGPGVRPVNVDRALWRDVLFAASDMGNIDIVRGVLDAGLASADSTDPESGDTALMHAAQYGRADVAQHLLDARANVDQVNNDCLTALGVAEIAGESKAIDILRRNNAYTLFSLDNTRQYTPEQLERIHRADRALYDEQGGRLRATRPTLMPLEASNQ